MHCMCLCSILLSVFAMPFLVYAPPHPSFCLSIQSSIKSSIPWLFLPTPLIYLSLSSSVIFVHLFDHPYPSDYFAGNIGISLLHFTKKITGTKGIRTRKWKWLELNHFFFITFKWEGIFKIDLVTYSMMFIRSFLVHCILGNIVSINILLEISHQEID